MLKRLAKHGNSYALVIERPILDLLRIDPEAPVEVVTDGNTLTIAPVRDEKRRRQFAAALTRANGKYGKMLKRLAE